MLRRYLRDCVLALGAACVALAAHAQVAWLRYAIPPDPPRYHDMPHTVVLLGNAAGHAAVEEQAAADELDRGLGHMVAGTDLLLHRFDPRVDAIVLGTTDAVHRARLGRSLPGWTEKPLPEEGFRIVHLRRGIRQWYILQGGSPRAELWAAFRFAALVAEDQQLPEELVEVPAMPLRGLDLGAWPEAQTLLASEPQVAALGRLLASTGANALVAGLDDPSQTSGASVADAGKILASYGVRLWLGVPSTAKAEAVEALIAAIPNAGGVVVQVSRHADAAALQEAVQMANALAQALPRSAGVMLQDALGDPLRSGSRSEAPGLSPEERAAMLRNTLSPRVIVAGAAVSPLLPLAGLGSANFGLLPGRSQAAAFDVLPVRHDELAVPYGAWQSALQTPERGVHGDMPLRDVLRVDQDGARGGVLGRISPGRLNEMLAQPMLQANLYAFARLAWNPSLTPEAVTEEWARQTWGDDARVFAVAQRIVLRSADAFLKNSSPMGLQTLADEHGGAAPSRASRTAPGGPLADRRGIGTDRTASGTGEIARYPADFAARLQDTARCPEEWLLAVHHVPYRQPLPDGKTVVQSVYDAHFAGAAEAANALDAWESTRGIADGDRYAAVHAFLAGAARQAEIWRETTTEWLQRVSGVPDALGFVGRHTGREEAEAMRRSGYTPARTAEPDDASGGALAVCGASECSAATEFKGPENVYRIEIGYFDEAVGSSTFELRVNGKAQAQWPSAVPLSGGIPPSAASARRFVVNGVRLRPGDAVEVHGVAAGGAQAPLDFVEITRDPRWN